MPSSPSPPISPSCAAPRIRKNWSSAPRARARRHRHRRPQFGRRRGARPYQGRRRSGLQIAVGARLVFADGTPGHSRLSAGSRRLGPADATADLGKSRAEKGECILVFSTICSNTSRASTSSSCRPRAIEAGEARRLLARLKEAASRQSVWLAASMLYRGDDGRRLARLARMRPTPHRAADRDQRRALSCA